MISHEWPLRDTTTPLEARARVAQLATLQSLRDLHALWCRAPLGIDITRGKPSPEQLDLSNPLLGPVGDWLTQDGADARNYYGSIQGVPQVRELFSEMLGAGPECIVIGNNSSLALMHDVLVYACLFGFGEGGWLSPSKSTAFLCPSPGYDRHFAICEALGIQMIPVRLTGSGPDMTQVMELVRDPAVKGMWCVPRFSNPTGETYSQEVVEKLALMQTGAKDFRLFWDNAYAVHELRDDAPELANILTACEQAGEPDRAFVFASTSKITFPGAGLGMLAASPRNIEWFVQHQSRRTIGPDKLNQLRHLRMLKDHAGILSHMARQRALIAPKFAAALEVLASRLGSTGIATWTRPEGGYFISVDVHVGCAARVVELARAAGVSMVPAGRTYPYGKDRRDTNLRIAPTYPTASQVAHAMEVVSACAALAALEHLVN